MENQRKIFPSYVLRAAECQGVISVNRRTAGWLTCVLNYQNHVWCTMMMFVRWCCCDSRDSSSSLKVEEVGENTKKSSRWKEKFSPSVGISMSCSNSLRLVETDSKFRQGHRTLTSALCGTRQCVGCGDKLNVNIAQTSHFVVPRFEIILSS